MCPSACEGRRGGPPSVLICDDAATVRTLVELKLQATLPGFSFRQAADGLEALEQLVAEPPGVLVLDVNMPTMDGTTLMCLLRHAADHAHEELRARLAGGLRGAAGAAGLAAHGVDAAALRVSEPRHPRRGAYVDEEVDASVGGILAVLDAVHGKDLDLGPDAVPLASLPHFLLGEVLGREELRRLPVVLVTTQLEPRQRARYERLGPPDGYLSKPFDADEAGKLVLGLTARG